MRSKKGRLSDWCTPLLLLGMALTDRSGLVWVTLLAAALHEGGHLLAARVMRIPFRAMRMDHLGVRLELGGRMPSFGEEWLLCAAGPLASLLCAALAAPLWPRWEMAASFSCASLLLGLLNLLPIRSFDGGRMLESLLSFLCGPRVGDRILTLTSLLFLFLLWATAVYFLLRVGDGLSLFCFSLGLFLRFWERERL